MKSQKNKEKIVTLDIFNKSIKSLQASIKKLDDKSNNHETRFNTLENKIHNLATSIINTNGRINQIEEKMATKDDIHLILDRIKSLEQGR